MRATHHVVTVASALLAQSPVTAVTVHPLASVFVYLETGVYWRLIGWEPHSIFPFLGLFLPSDCQQCRAEDSQCGFCFCDDSGTRGQSVLILAASRSPDYYRTHEKLRKVTNHDSYGSSHQSVQLR
jgi:hypothetical protein